MFTKKPTKTHKIKLTLELEFTDSILDFETIERYVQAYFKDTYTGSGEKGFSSFILDMMRITKTSLWDSKEIKVEEGRPE